MNTILSIDLDILLSPYVGIYNPLVDNHNCQKIWENINHTFININDFLVNSLYLKKIENILNIYSKQVNNIYIGLDHSSIFNAIETEKNNLNKPYLFNLYNIDYHHDIIYTDEQYKKITEQQITDCGSWVGYLNYYNFLNNYYWYYGIGSMFNTININTYQSIYPNLISNNFQNINLDISNIDILFISISPQWIPMHCYNIIKQLLLKLPQHKIIYYKNPYFYNINQFSLLEKNQQKSYFDFLDKKKQETF